jgi:hypothetical protein
MENSVHGSPPKERLKQELTRSAFIEMNKKEMKSLKSYFNRFDNLIMRPLLIYKFDKELFKKR